MNRLNVISGKTPFKDELFIQNIKENYNVVSLRDGKKVVWNKKPLLEDEALKLVKELQKSKIPSVDINSIQMIPVKSSEASVDEFEKRIEKVKSILNSALAERKNGEYEQWLKDILRDAQDEINNIMRMRIKPLKN